jgi:hypothetical protein
MFGGCDGFGGCCAAGALMASVTAAEAISAPASMRLFRTCMAILRIDAKSCI